MDRLSFLLRLTAYPALKQSFANVLDRLFLCEQRGGDVFTDFFDPFACAVFVDALNAEQHDCAVRAFGGAPDCERKMLGFSHGELPDHAFPVKLLRADADARFGAPPRHKDIMGAVLGLGISRAKVGDIVVCGTRAYIFAHTEIAGYIQSQLAEAGRTRVKTSFADIADEDVYALSAGETVLTVASLRLDAVAAACFKLSRSQTAALIAAKKVFVNWQITEDASRQIKENDTLTVRGYGRARLVGVDGATKKDRVRIRAAVSR